MMRSIANAAVTFVVQHTEKCSCTVVSSGLFHFTMLSPFPTRQSRKNRFVEQSATSAIGAVTNSLSVSLSLVCLSLVCLPDQKQTQIAVSPTYYMMPMLSLLVPFYIPFFYTKAALLFYSARQRNC